MPRHRGQTTPAPVAPTGGRGAANPQPVQVASGGKHGSRQALENQQAGAPLPTAPGAGSGADINGPINVGPPLTRPTDRPSEPPSTGATPGGIPDVDLAIRAMFDAFPHPWLQKLIRKGGGG